MSSICQSNNKGSDVLINTVIPQRGKEIPVRNQIGVPSLNNQIQVNHFPIPVIVSSTRSTRTPREDHRSNIGNCIRITTNNSNLGLSQNNN